MFEIIELGFTVLSVMAFCGMLAYWGQQIAVRYFAFPEGLPRFATTLVGFGVGYGACAVTLGLMFRCLKRFSVAWYLLLIVLVLVSLYEVIRKTRTWKWTPSRSDWALNLSAAGLGLLGAVATIYVWCSPSFYGMGHSDKYAMFSQLFLWSDEPVELSQHYASTLLTSGLHLMTGWSLEILNWLTQSLLKTSLLCMVYACAFKWSGERGLAVWVLLAFGLVSGAFSLRLYDFIDSGGPFLLMTYADRVLGFLVVFLWLLSFQAILDERQSGEGSQVERLLRFSYVWGATAVFLAISAEDILLLLFVPIAATAGVLVFDLYQSRKEGKYLAGSLARVAGAGLLVLYFVSTQGGLLTYTPKAAGGREEFKIGNSAGAHQVKVAMSSHFGSTAGLWFREYPDDRAISCHFHSSASGWDAWKELFRITGVGFLAFFVLFVLKNVSPSVQNVLWNDQHRSFRINFIWLAVSGVILALYFDDGIGRETVSRFFQWALFLSFAVVGYLVATLFSRSYLGKLVAVLLFVLTAYPIMQYLTRPFMTEHLRKVASLPWQTIREIVPESVGQEVRQ